MNLTEREQAVLLFIAIYYAATRPMIQAECFPATGKDGAVVRKVLNDIFHRRLINKTNGEVVFAQNGAHMPVWFPSRQGLEAVAEFTGDASFLTRCSRTPNPANLHHITAVAQSRITLDKAIRLQSEAKVDSWIAEWEEKDPQADGKVPEKKYRLFTKLRDEPRLVTSPDAGFLLNYKGYKKVYFVEFDRGTTGIQKIAASKTPGYAAMLEQQAHRKLFPETNITDFSVLSISLTANRRDLLRNAMRDKAGAKLWKFISWTDYTSEKLLFDSVIYDCETANPLVNLPGKDAYPLIKRPETKTEDVA